MKPISILTLLMMCLVFLACKKKHTCECTASQTNAAGVTTTQPLTSTELTDVSKSKAKILCQSSSTVETIGTSVTTDKLDCELK